MAGAQQRHQAYPSQDRILERYHTPGYPEAFSGVQNVARQNRVPHYVAADALVDSESYGLHRQYRRPVRRNPYYTMYRRQQCQLDLIDVQHLGASNRGYGYILVLIDCFSRKMWLRPIVHKSGAHVVAALRSIFQEMGDLPRQIVCDRGREFVNQDVANFLASMGMQPLVHPNSEMKGAIVERVNKSLQSLMYKYMSEDETRSFEHILRDLLTSYNNRPHRSIDYLTPNEGEQEIYKNRVASALREHYSKAIEKPNTEPKFKLKEKVRIKTGYGMAFPRGYEEQFSREQFRVARVNRRMAIPMYQLRSRNDNQLIAGAAYKEELQRAPRGDILRFTVLRYATLWDDDEQAYVPKMLVRWKGFDQRHDQWLRQDIPLAADFSAAAPQRYQEQQGQQQQQ